MELNGLGIDMSEMLDTDTGMLVTGEPPKVDEPEKVEEAKTGIEDDMIEVNLEEDPTIINEKNSGADEDVVIDDEQSSSSLPKFKVLANALHEKGVLSALDESKFDDEDAEEAEVLIELIKEEITKNNNSYKESLPKTIKDLIDNYEENVPLDELIGLKSTKMRLESITEDQVKGDENLQKLIIEENYKRLGMSEARIKKRIQQFEDLSQLEEESVDALKESKEYIEQSIIAEKENAKKREAEFEKERLNSLKSLKEDINKTASVIDGINISDREKELIYESMTKVVDKDEAGRPMNSVMVTRAKNPVGFEKMLHYYHSLGLFNIKDDGTIDPDISKIKTGAKKSAMDELNSAIRGSQLPSSGTPARETTLDRDKLKDNIKSMKSLIR